MKACPVPYLDLVLDDLWCLCTSQRTSLRPEEIAYHVIGFINGLTMTKVDGTPVPDKQFQFYVDDLAKRIEKL